MGSNPLRIGLIASAAHRVGQPFAGGMEAHTVALAGSLRERGHDVTIHAARGTDTGGVEPVCDPGHQLRFSAAARADVSMPAEAFMAEHHAYLSLMLGLDAREYDLVHNNCLHYLPVAMAATVRTPMLTTLHSPPTPWLESAIRCGGAHERRGSRWVSVSLANARAWSHACARCEVIHNGVDPETWAYRETSAAQTAVWSGRIVPEKGLHHAVEAARLAGVPLGVAGPVVDRGYFERCMAQGGKEVTYHGHLESARLARLVGAAAVSLVTPCWEEPFGLVAIESLACGTPVAGFARGALGEIVDDSCGTLATPEDPQELARLLEATIQKSRSACRERAVASFSLDEMTDRYEVAYRSLL